MKQVIKQTLMFIAVLCAYLSSYAYDFEVDGIYYNIVSFDDMTCEVTSGDKMYSGDVVIPSEVTYNNRQLSVIQIGNSAFSGCSSLASVTISNSVTKIGEDAFFRCTSLTSIPIPESVTSIGAGAFNNCSLLSSVSICRSTHFGGCR